MEKINLCLDHNAQDDCEYRAHVKQIKLGLVTSVLVLGFLFSAIWWNAQPESHYDYVNMICWK